MSQRPPRHVPLDQANDWDRETQRAFAGSCATGQPCDGRAIDRPLAQERAASPQAREREVRIKAQPPLPPKSEEVQRQASAGVVPLVSQPGLLADGIQGYVQEGLLSSAIGAYLDGQNAS